MDDAPAASPRSSLRDATLGLGLAGTLLTLPLRQRLASTRPSVARWALRWLPLLALALGALAVQVYSGSWAFFGYQGAHPKLMPALALTLTLACTQLARPLLGLAAVADLVSGQRLRLDTGLRDRPLRPVGALALVLGTLTLLVVFASLPTGLPWSPGGWLQGLAWACPPMPLAVVALAPMWAALGLAIACAMGRAAPDSDRLTAELCEAGRAGSVLVAALPATLLTCLWLSRWPDRLYGPVVALSVFAVATACAVALARRCGGQTRHTLAATSAMALFTGLLTSAGVARHVAYGPS